MANMDLYDVVKEPWVNSKGKVPIVFNGRHMKWFQNDVAGFDPDQAEELTSIRIKITRDGRNESVPLAEYVKYREGMDPAEKRREKTKAA